MPEPDPFAAFVDRLAERVAEVVAVKLVGEIRQLAPPAPNQEQRRLAVSREEAGKLIGVSTETIKRLVARGELEAVAAGARVVVPIKSIEAFLSKRKESLVTTG